MPLINGVAVNDRQQAVYDMLKQYGPLTDTALVPLAQHMIHVHQSSSGIRTRRSELVNKGLVAQIATTTTGSGRSAGVYEAI